MTNEHLHLSDVLETVIYARSPGAGSEPGSGLDAMERFYREVLGLERVRYTEGRSLMFRLTRGVLLIFNPDETRDQTNEVNGARIPPHGATGPGHVAFRVTHETIDAWRARIVNCGVEIESDVRWENGARSVYFRDPAGNSVELVTPDLWDLPAEP